MVDLYLYQNTSEQNKLNKTLENEYHMEGNLKEQTSVSNPVIMIENENPTTYNYAYIPQFGRYYYIVDVSSVRNGLWQIAFKCDVLMSFKDYILQSDAIIKNTEVTDVTSYMDSDIWKALVKTKTDIVNFSSGLLESGEYILITAGG